MKKLFDMLVLLLALNFIAVAAGVGGLAATGKLNRTSALAVKEVLFPAAVTGPTTQPSTQPASTSQPVSRLDALLAKHPSFHSAAEQVNFLQQSFDAERAQLDERERQLQDLQTLVAAAQEKLERDRAALTVDRTKLTDEQQESARLASDKGFQDSLNLYNSMPSKQVKSIFMSMDDASVAEYLQAMPPRSAARIMKEYKSPDELGRLHRVMDQIRPSPTSAASAPATRPSVPR